MKQGDCFTIYTAEGTEGAQGGILLTVGQLEAWAGRCLTEADLERLADAIPNSTVPEAIGLIVEGMEDRDART